MTIAVANYSLALTPGYIYIAIIVDSAGYTKQYAYRIPDTEHAGKEGSTDNARDRVRLYSYLLAYLLTSS